MRPKNIIKSLNLNCKLKFTWHVYMFDWLWNGFTRSGCCNISCNGLFTSHIVQIFSEQFTEQLNIKDFLSIPCMRINGIQCFSVLLCLCDSGKRHITWWKPHTKDANIEAVGLPGGKKLAGGKMPSVVYRKKKILKWKLLFGVHNYITSLPT